MSEQFPGCNMKSTRGSFKTNSFEMNEFPYQPLKISNDFDQISLVFQTVFESEDRSFSQTVRLDFSWTLEMSDQQIDWFARPSWSLNSSPVATRHHPAARSRANSFKVDEFSNQPLKKFNINFDKTNLPFQTVFESEARSLLPTVQLYFSWTLEMSYRQNDWFARSSEGQSISPSAT